MEEGQWEEACELTGPAAPAGSLAVWVEADAGAAGAAVGVALGCYASSL